MAEERLQKIIAERGVCSRRAAEQLILEGRVWVNGKPVTQLGAKADPEYDKITVDSKAVTKRPAKHRYLLLHKPAGYITSVNDEHGRRTIFALLPDEKDRLYPVGRLDYATSGALLVTNDGVLTNALLHPKWEVDKTYHCTVAGHVTKEQLNRLCTGVQLYDGMTAPAKAKVFRRKEDRTIVEITIHEGRNRQIRRMMTAVGLKVIWLKRVGFAGLDLKDVPIATYRELTPAEVRRLYELAGIKQED